MKDHLRQLVQGLDPVRGRNVLREYLQARILEALQQEGAFAHIAFQGGTALRFLYGLPRWSEDLDFALEGAREGYDLRGWLKSAEHQFVREGYSVRTVVRDRTAVHAGWLRFSRILHETGLSPHADQVVAVKVDVDSNPPAGAGLRTRLVRRHVSLRLWHHDRASLLAGKLHAILRRPFAKGRDLYDLAWYLGDPGWPAPNLELLNAALSQVSPEDSRRGPEDSQTDLSARCRRRHLTAATWPSAVARRLESLPWDRLAEDVRPFLERKESLATREELWELLAARGSLS